MYCFILSWYAIWCPYVQYIYLPCKSIKKGKHSDQFLTLIRITFSWRNGILSWNLQTAVKIYSANAHLCLDYCRCGVVVCTEMGEGNGSAIPFWRKEMWWRGTKELTQKIKIYTSPPQILCRQPLERSFRDGPPESSGGLPETAWWTSRTVWWTSRTV